MHPQELRRNLLGRRRRRGFRPRATVLSRGGREGSGEGPRGLVPPAERGSRVIGNRSQLGSSVLSPGKEGPLRPAPFHASHVAGRKGRATGTEPGPPARSRGLAGPSRTPHLSRSTAFLRPLFSLRGSAGANPLCSVGVNVPFRGVYSFTVSVALQSHTRGARGTSCRHFLQDCCCLFRPGTYLFLSRSCNESSSKPCTLPLALSLHGTSGCSSGGL